MVFLKYIKNKGEITMDILKTFNITSSTLFTTITDIVNNESETTRELHTRLFTWSERYSKMIANKEVVKPTEDLNLYKNGLTISEIALLRGVTRQAISQKYLTETIAKEQESLLHIFKREELFSIIVDYYKDLAEKNKDLSLMDSVFSSNIRSNKRKYLIYLELGGDPQAIKFSDIDKRRISVETNPEMSNAYKLFSKGLKNREVSDRLNLDLALVVKYRRTYNR